MILPYFEVKGERYEIKRTRYLLAEYDKLGKSTSLTEEDKANALTAQMLLEKVQKFAEKLKDLEELFFDDLSNDVLEKQYLACEKIYRKSVEELAEFEAKTGSTTRLQKEGIDLLEKILIEGLKEQYNFSEKEAIATWGEFVNDVGKKSASEWLTGMAQVLFTEEQENDTPFMRDLRKHSKKKKN